MTSGSTEANRLRYGLTQSGTRVQVCEFGVFGYPGGRDHGARNPLCNPRYIGMGGNCLIEISGSLGDRQPPLGPESMPVDL